MRLDEFEINKLFFTHAGQWMCTDIGTRTITAVNYAKFLEAGDKQAPYSIVEHSFDTYDMDGCWQATDLEGVDIESFRVLSMSGLDVVCRDKNHIYINDELMIINGSIDCYVYLDGPYSKDDTYVYYKGNIVSGADAASFEALIHDFARDKNNVFMFGVAINAVDPTSFSYLQDGLFRDKDHLFFGAHLVPEIDLNDFQLLAHHIARSKDKLYYFDDRHYTVSEIVGVDHSTLDFSSETYLRDAHFDYELIGRVWQQNEHDVLKLRKLLSFRHGKFFTWLEKFLFDEDILEIAQDGFDEEYALERDEILVGIENIETVAALSELLVLIFTNSFDMAALKVDRKRYQILAEKIWVAYWYMRGQADARS